MSDGGRIFAITYAEGSRTGGLQPWVGMGSAKAALENPEVPPEIQIG